jgi:hypothetical protein
MKPLQLMLTNDAADNSIFHLAALSPKLEVFECLSIAIDKLYISDVSKVMMKTDRSADEKLFYAKKTLNSLEYMSFLEKESKMKSTTADKRMSLSSSYSYHEFNHSLTNLLEHSLIPANAKDAIKFGWLYKSKSGNDWKKRWCVISGTDIIYYTSKSDTLPKGVISLTDCKIIRPLTHGHNLAEPVFHINSKLGAKKMKKRFFGFISSDRSSSYFKADSEIELHEWLFIIRALAGNIPTRYVQASHFINLTARQLIVQQVNAKHENPLHILVRYAKNNKPNCKDEDKLDLLSCLYFLIRHGCNPEQKNNDGHTAIEIAFAKNNTELLHWLRLLSHIHAREGMQDEGKPLLLPALKLPGYSYLSLVFRKMKYSNQIK